MSSNDVIEATAALKGILGIGNALNTNAASRKDAGTGPDSRSIEEHKNHNPPDLKTVLSPDQKSGSKKKKVKKKKKPSQISTSQNSPQANNPISPVSKNNHPHNYNQGDKRNAKTKKSNPTQYQTPSNAVTKGKKKENSNFAWSAFQSPPDASSLPLPAFSGSDLFSDSHTPAKSQQSPQEELANDKFLDLNIVVKSVEQLENEVIAAAEAAAASKKAESIPSPTPNTNLLEKSQEKHEAKKDEQKQEQANDNQEAKEEQSTPPKSTSAPKSHSGVNLAALTSSKKPAQQNLTPSKPDISFAELMNASSSKQPQNYNQAHQHPPIQLTSQNPYSNPQHHQQQQYFPHQHQQQIVTIQVQIPPVLLPGRQMMVHTPAGYPIPVVVPENMRPGMIIPVNVPAPMSFHPHHPQIQPHQQHPNQFRYPNQNIPPHQHQHLTPYNLGQDPYYPNSYNQSKPSTQYDPSPKKK